MRYPLEIEVGDYFFDHRFEGRCVFPAAAALNLLAKVVHDHFPNLDMSCLIEARFPRFLIIPPEMQNIPVIVEIDNTPRGDISARLMTSMRSRTGGIGRYLEHARVEFSQIDSSSGVLPSSGDKERPKGPAFVVSKEWIYPGLIPFGKAFQNIIGPVSLWSEEASASLSGGDYGTEDDRIGSLFPLDAALQVACVWGQRFTDYVLFPIGIEKKVIHQKTKKNSVYTGRIFPAGAEKNQFFFDAWIINDQGAVCEEILSIQMQDVSQGRLHPPLWIKDLFPLKAPKPI